MENRMRRLVALWVSAWIGVVSGAEVRGTVTGLLGDSVVVTVPDGQGAMPGDAVRVVFETGGVEMLAGAGEVASSNGRDVTVRLREGQEKVTVTMQAIIESSGVPATDPPRAMNPGGTGKQEAPPVPPAQGSAEELFARGKALYDQQAFASALAPLQAAAEQDHAEAMTLVGVLYAEDLGAAKDDKIALSWFRRAAAAGDATAAHNAGIMLESGRGTEKDLAEAFKWYQQAAERGNRNSMFEVGRFHEFGNAGLSVDHAKALEWYRKAADLGLPVALRAVGWAIYNGIAVQKDERAALIWFQKAADGGSPLAQNDVGLYHLEGRAGVEQDSVQAIQWFQKSAEGGWMYGMWNLARCLENGYGTPVNKEMALYWYRKASQLGHEAAGQKVRELEGR